MQVLKNTYWKKLYAIAYRRLGDEELAKDTVQDVLNIRDSLTKQDVANTVNSEVKH